MKNLIYILFIFLGFTLPFISLFVINKKNKLISKEYLFYSYILFLICFIFFSKIFNIFLDFNINNLKLIFTSNNILYKLKFIFSGYSFIGGYFGGIFSIFIFSKLVKEKFSKLLILYLPVLYMMYGILKIGCFINGCCSSYLNIPIQLIESIISLCIYFYIVRNLNKLDKTKIIRICFISFGCVRFIISFFREYTNLYSFIFIELIALILIFIGLKIKCKKET